MPAAGWATTQSFIGSATAPPSWRLMITTTRAFLSPASAAPARNRHTASSPHSNSPTGMICAYRKRLCRAVKDRQREMRRRHRLHKFAVPSWPAAGIAG